MNYPQQGYPPPAAPQPQPQPGYPPPQPQPQVQPGYPPQQQAAPGAPPGAPPGIDMQQVQRMQEQANQQSWTAVCGEPQRNPTSREKPDDGTHKVQLSLKLTTSNKDGNLYLLWTYTVIESTVPTMVGREFGYPMFFRNRMQLQDLSDVAKDIWGQDQVMQWAQQGVGFQQVATYIAQVAEGKFCKLTTKRNMKNGQSYHDAYVNHTFREITDNPAEIKIPAAGAQPPVAGGIAPQPGAGAPPPAAPQPGYPPPQGQAPAAPQPQPGYPPPQGQAPAAPQPPQPQQPPAAPPPPGGPPPLPGMGAGAPPPPPQAPGTPPSAPPPPSYHQ